MLTEDQIEEKKTKEEEERERRKRKLEILKEDETNNPFVVRLKGTKEIPEPKLGAKTIKGNNSKC